MVDIAWWHGSRPSLEGLGIPNLHILNLALCLQQIDIDRPWWEFNIQVPVASHAVFKLAMH
jgi:hypothetical protein